MTKETEPKIEQQMLVNQDPTSSSDYVRISSRSDGNVLLQFVSTLPDIHIENHRTVLSKQVAISLVDKLANALNHYPEKPAEVEKAVIKKQPKKTTKKPAKKK